MERVVKVTDIAIRHLPSSSSPRTVHSPHPCPPLRLPPCLFPPIGSTKTPSPSLASSPAYSTHPTPRHRPPPPTPPPPPPTTYPTARPLLTSTLSTALEHCNDLVLLFTLPDQTNGSGVGWDDGREQWRFVEGVPGGVVRGKRERAEDGRRRRGWRGGGGDDERDSDEEEDERVLTVLEYYRAQCANRAAALQSTVLSSSSPPRSPRSASPPPPLQPSRPATPPTRRRPTPSRARGGEAATTASSRRAVSSRDSEASKGGGGSSVTQTPSRQRSRKTVPAILNARQQQEQRDLDRELRTLQPLLSALAITPPAKKTVTAPQLAALRAAVDQQLRHRVCGGVGVWKWSKKRVGGEVRRRECEVRWDVDGGCVAWEGRKRWRRVQKTVAGIDVERLIVGGGLAGGVFEEWKARMRATSRAEERQGQHRR